MTFHNEKLHRIINVNCSDSSSALLSFVVMTGYLLQFNKPVFLCPTPTGRLS